MTTLSAVAPRIAAASPLAASQTVAAAVMAKAKAQAAALKARAQTAGIIDNTPPSLTRFSMGGTVNAQLQGAAALANMTITDDLSGVQFVTLTLSSPSGAQSATLYNILNSGEKTYSGRFAVGSQDLLDFGGRFTRYSEPGTWTAQSMLVADLAGNLAIYSQDQLAALGNATVQVKNSGGYDIVPPALESGRVLTRRISLGTPPAGTGAGNVPYIDAALTVTDTGNGAVSGAKIASMVFCLPDQWGNCQDTFELDGTADAPHMARTTLRMTGSPHAGQITGKYGLMQVFLQDVAGNPVVIDAGLQAFFPDGMVVDVEP